MNTAKNICVVLVGLGGIGKEWLEVLNQNTNVKRIHVVDINPRAIDYALLHSKKVISTQTSLHDIHNSIISESLICIDASPPDAHVSNGIFCIDKRLNLLQEKPLTLTKSELELQKSKLKVRKTKYGINYTYRYTDWFNLLQKQIINEKVTSIDLKLVLSQKGTNFRASMNNPLLFDYFIHHVNMMYALLKTKKNIDIINGHFFRDNLSSTYKGKTSLSAKLNIDGTKVNIFATIAAKENETLWEGDWIIKTNSSQYEYYSKNATLFKIDTKRYLLIEEDTQWIDRLSRSFDSFLASIQFNTVEKLPIEEHLLDLENLMLLDSLGLE